MDINILAIESSCDETSAAVMQNGVILSNIIATQKVHEKYGGVVPELASRAHQQQIVPVVDRALVEAGIKKEELSAVAHTQGPGLLGALLVGSSFAKSLCLGLNIPLISVNHMQAHILAHFIDDPKPTFPMLCLTVSGGHTQLVRVDESLEMRIVGETKDDAVGEAFDKAAKLLGLNYPGGPLIDKHAKEGDPDKFQFAETSMPDLDYSFSGIKTSILYFLQKEMRKNENFIKENMNDLCASIQKSLISMLMEKLIKAAKKEDINEIAIAGGVSANSGLRQALMTEGDKQGWNVYIPKFEYCTDNAAMIAMAGHFKYLKNDFALLSSAPMPRMPF
ncbi:tRNA (adenosine(37)-N6)-threonylcarbamoyltransferase complex transferase subunit TsaD [Reichenbachiella sp. MALMAid0571]|uniref:tRNA (adenosine(37)-N6)-threonylcarbamoyltransferase complex transferase subunit TsaD n=1 Tax=Reichenbachiella sp. MALMAid0571 TaxID=3143939 RepID=UPI0032DF2A42